MTRRIFRTSFLVALTTLLLSVLMLMGVLHRHFESQIFGELAQSARLAARGLAVGGIPYLEGLGGDRHRITLVGPDGGVLFDNQADPQTMENHAGREEIHEALTGGTGESVRVSQTLADRTIYYAVLTSEGSVLRLSITQDTELRLLSRLLFPIAGICALALLLSAFLASRLAGRIIKPINGIDPEHPELFEAYEELTPLLAKIHDQNKMIQKQMSALKQTKQEFDAITGHMNEGLIVLDAAGRILSINESARRILGAPEEPSGQSVLTLNRSEAFVGAVEAAGAGRGSSAVLQLSGRSFQLLANPVAENGAVGGAILLLLDVTEKREWEKIRSEFTANVSHELKTPLTSISGIAEIMKNGLVKPSDMPHFAENIYKETRRLIALVSDIIKLSQLDERAIPIEMAPADLYELAQTVIERLEGPAREKGLTVTLEGEHAFVTGVSQILEEMIYNLADNAIKYNKPGGSVALSVWETGEGIRLRVADTGIGIPPEDVNRVFERFYRVDKSHSKAVGGTGLGLSIVKHGAAFHAAQVELESRLGEGTTVTIKWP